MSLSTDGRLALSSSGPLRPEFPVWALFGRLLLAGIGFLFIIPAPWTSTALYRFVVDHVALPDGKRLNFTGQPTDIWYVLMGLPALSWLHGLIEQQHLRFAVGAAVALASWALTVMVIQWFCAKLTSEDGRLSISFEGGYWPYIGWNLLLIVSIMTIVGWAWVMKFMMQWVCRSVRGSASFDFTATGWEVLWRTFVLGLACIFIIPIPWIIRWYKTWFVSQISVGPPSANAAV
jgi:hypothetical protein